MPGRRIRELPLIGATRSELLKRRFARAVRAIGDRYRAGELPAAHAGGGRQPRAAPLPAPGDRGPCRVHASRRHRASELASAAPVLTELIDVQFNADSTGGRRAGSDSAEELIRSWT